MHGSKKSMKNTVNFAMCYHICPDAISQLSFTAVAWNDYSDDGNCFHTLKYPAVDPVATQPYCTFVCLARSSAELMGLSILSIVKKAARLAV